MLERKEIRDTLEKFIDDFYDRDDFIIRHLCDNLVKLININGFETLLLCLKADTVSVFNGNILDTTFVFLRGRWIDVEEEDL